MVKDLINAIPTSRGTNSGLDQHLCQSRPLCRPSVSALGSGLTLVLIPDLVLPSWLVWSIEKVKVHPQPHPSKCGSKDYV